MNYALIFFCTTIVLGFIAVIVASISELLQKAKKPDTLQEDPEVENLRKRMKATAVTPQEMKNVNTNKAEDDWLPRPDTAIEILDNLLSDNGCKKEFFHRDEKWIYCGFVFQGGYFTVKASSDDQQLSIAYGRFYDADTKDADCLTAIANRVNANLNVVKVVCNFSEKDNKVYLDLLFETFDAKYDSVLHFLRNASFVAGKICQEIGLGEWDDGSERYYDDRREQYLRRELELHHQETTIISNPAEPLTIGSLIEQLYDKTDAVLVRTMHISAQGKVRTMKDAEQIFHYNIIPLVYDVEQRKLRHNAVVQVVTEQNKYILHLNALQQSDFTVYIRLTAMQFALDNKHTEQIKTIRPNAISLLVAYDKTTKENQHSEYEYMILDANDKQKQGKESELSREQQLLLKLGEVSYSETIYRGCKLFYAGRYFESLTLLLPVYKEMKPEFFRMENRVRDVFYHVCYIIGFCYTELKQYDRAYYYLEIAHHANRYDCASEYINALANAGDLRVFSVIDNMMEVLKHNIKESDDGEPTEEQMNFYEFLLRRRGYACIEFRDLDNAEKIFTDLLECPKSKDYALSELAYIRGLRKLRQNPVAAEQ